MAAMLDNQTDMKARQPEPPHRFKTMKTALTLRRSSWAVGAPSVGNQRGTRGEPEGNQRVVQKSSTGHSTGG